LFSLLIERRCSVRTRAAAIRQWPARRHGRATTASWTIYRWGWQFAGSKQPIQAYVLSFGAFGAA
jgi:hypothetical protein